MKAILIAIKPPHMANILKGDKTIEARKNKALANAVKKMIAEQGYAQFLAYCSKDGWLLYDKEQEKYFSTTKKRGSLDRHPYDSEYEQNLEYELTACKHLEGKVVCSFKCYNEEIINVGSIIDVVGYYTEKKTIANEKDLLEKTCLSFHELDNYLKSENGFAIHISDLHIFDKPKELKEFYGYCDNYAKDVNIFENANNRYVAQYFKNSKCLKCKHYDGDNGCSKIEEPLIKAPQNFCYVEIPDNK